MHLQIRKEEAEDFTPCEVGKVVAIQGGGPALEYECHTIHRIPYSAMHVKAVERTAFSPRC